MQSLPSFLAIDRRPCASPLTGKNIAKYIDTYKHKTKCIQPFDKNRILMGSWIAMTITKTTIINVNLLQLTPRTFAFNTIMELFNASMQYLKPCRNYFFYYFFK